MASRSAESDRYPERAVLEGVPKIGFHKHLCLFVGSLHACLEYLGTPRDYDYLMGVSGAAFRRFWNRDDGGNVDLMYLAPEPYVRAFWAIGRAHRVIPATDREAMVDALKESIAAGKPVLGFGIIGPPECGIVAGYDRRGDVLVGYSYFQDPALPGYYEKADWYEEAEFHKNHPAPGGLGCIVIGESIATPPEREILVSSLEWAVDLARTAHRPETPNHLSGLAAYEGWADGLDVDADYPPGNEQILGVRTMVHGDQATMLEERRSAAKYLRGMAAVAPEVADELGAAATFYDETAGEMAGIWLWGESMGPEVGRGLADPAKRHGIAAHVRAAREKEVRAVEQLEKALAKLR